MHATQANVPRPSPAGRGKRLSPAFGIVLALGVIHAPQLQGFDFGVIRIQSGAAEMFAKYIAAVDAQFERSLAGGSPFLWSNQDQDRAKALARGEIVIESTPMPQRRRFGGGVVHDWTGAMLVPHADAKRLVGLVSAYDTHADTFAPEVVRSRILERDGTQMRVAMRLVKKNVLTVVLDVEHLVEFVRLDDRRWWGRTKSTSIREVENAGKPAESLRPPGHDRGFLWGMVVYWRFADTPDGTIVEHRSINLTRSLPKGIRWVLSPVLNGLPRRSLANILVTTSDAALAPLP